MTTTRTELSQAAKLSAEAGPPQADGQDGVGADLPAAADDDPASRPPDLSVFAAGDGDRPSQPGLVRRHHLHSDAARLPLPGCGDGLVDAEGFVLAGVEHHGC